MLKEKRLTIALKKHRRYVVMGNDIEMPSSVTSIALACLERETACLNSWVGIAFADHGGLHHRVFADNAAPAVHDRL